MKIRWYCSFVERIFVVIPTIVVDAGFQDITVSWLFWHIQINYNG